MSRKRNGAKDAQVIKGIFLAIAALFTVKKGYDKGKDKGWFSKNKNS